MKINRTFSIDYDLAQKLRNKPNQSKLVCKAVRRYLAGAEQYTTTDIPTDVLLELVQGRKDCPPAIQALIWHLRTSS